MQHLPRFKVSLFLRMQTRLKQYAKKVSKAATEKELRETRRSVTVDVAGVNRFITYAVPDLSDAQRQALREVRGGGHRVGACGLGMRWGGKHAVGGNKHANTTVHQCN